MGHWYAFSVPDILSRYLRMKGKNIMYPIGFDSFGLPAENAAIKRKIKPKDWTEKNIKRMTAQLKSMGGSFDWSRQVITSDPEYYKWTQWLFLQLYKAGLVYRGKTVVNWCPKDKTVLANEQVINGRCERDGEPVVQKETTQWMLRITEYADRLIDDLDKVDWPETAKIAQRNWIGRSCGAEIKFRIKNSKIIIPVFTTRIDTLFGVTYVVVAPEHMIIEKLSPEIKNWSEVKKYIDQSKSKTELQRVESKEKTGIQLKGIRAINPIDNEEIPIWVADYALAHYGTGAVMAVPAHDERDFEFAKKYKLPLIVVISPPDYELNVDKMNRAYVDDGVMINSEDFNGMNNRDAIGAIADLAEEKKYGKRTINFKLKDWLISRQRYWGTPIPAIHCDKCGIVPVPEKDLPILLPEKVKFGKGNPLATNKSFVDVKCPKCRGKAKRETDTMDTFFDSSWYFLRYCDSQNNKQAFDKKKVKYWMPVDQYIGGAEHACMHLIYARFFTKALRDMNLLHFDEPFTRLFNQGMLHGEDGHVMSKSRGNVVLPEEISEKYGIDTARFFLVSIASPDKDLEWSSKGIEGSARFMKKLLSYFDTVNIRKSSSKVESKLNKAIKGVTEDIENFRYNFAIIKLRGLFDALEQEVSKDTLEKFLKLLHPFCPHFTEELWEKIGNKSFISLANWPKYDEGKIDLQAEETEKIIENTISDIRSVLELTKTDKPEEIILFVADKWKYKFISDLKKAMEKTRDIGKIGRASCRERV